MENKSQDIECMYTVHSSIITSHYVDKGSFFIAHPTSDGGSKVVKIDPDKKETILFESSTARYLTIVMYDDESIILYNCDSQRKNDTMTYEKGQIIKIDLKTLESTILLEAKSHYDEETNTYNGEMFGDVGYIDHQGFVYSLERLKKEGFGEDNPGVRETSIWYYDFETCETVKLFDYGYHVDKIYGNKEIIVIEDYRISDTPVKTCKLAVLQDGHCVIYTLDKEKTMGRGSVFYNQDNIIYKCYEEVIVIDLLNKTYQQYLCDDNELFFIKDHLIWKESYQDNKIILTEYLINK